MFHYITEPQALHNYEISQEVKTDKDTAGKMSYDHTSNMLRRAIEEEKSYYNDEPEMPPLEEPVDEEGAYQCLNCNKIYKSHNSLYIHKKYYCGTTPEIPCPEKDCNYKSKRKHNVYRHMRTVHNIMY